MEFDGRLVKVVDFSHNKQGRGSAQVRMTLRDLRTGAITTHSVQAGARFPAVRLERNHVQFLYRDGGDFHFMNLDDYGQIALSAEEVGDVAGYLVEGMVVSVSLYRGTPIAVELPAAVELEVTYAEPGVKGDTRTGATKPVTLQTGLQIQVPLFVEQGDRVKVDTRSGEYLTRV